MIGSGEKATEKVFSTFFKFIMMNLLIYLFMLSVGPDNGWCKFEFWILINFLKNSDETGINERSGSGKFNFRHNFLNLINAFKQNEI